MILDTSAMRFRELYGFNHPDEGDVCHADAGRGVDIFYFGVPADWRLPLRAYHGGMFFKNGVPAGYIEVLSFVDRAEVGFNLYYTFREGESAWLYARLLHLFHEELGVNCFSRRPLPDRAREPRGDRKRRLLVLSQAGVSSRFARDPDAYGAGRAAHAAEPGDPQFAAGSGTAGRRPILYEGPGAEKGAWDNFRIRDLAQAIQAAGGGISEMLGAEAAGIFEAKNGAKQIEYLRRMQQNPGLRASLLKLGGPPHAS